MKIDKQVTKEQWDRLNNDQKNSFQEEVGINYENEKYPLYEDVLIFLGNNKLVEDSSGDLHTPSAPEDIDILWERVFSFLNS